MKKENKVYIATSLDGYIADQNGGLDWLHSIPNPENSDMGYADLTASIDALVMGRVTFETVCSFDIDWPYQKPVFVWSRTLKEVPVSLKDKVYLVKGTVGEILEQIHQKGFYKLYIDGGKTIQSFLKEDLVDRMTITIIPKLLGGGFPLFAELPSILDFECIDTQLFSNQVVQNTFVRKHAINHETTT